MTDNTDRARVRVLLKLDHLTTPQWRELSAIVERNQNDGVFAEDEWRALRDWLKAENRRYLARHKALEVLLWRL